MNGSRQNEHRKGRVKVVNWMLLIGAMAGLVALGATCTKDAEGAERGDMGFLNEGTHFCTATQITPKSVEKYEAHSTIIEKLEELGFESLTEEERQKGWYYQELAGCGTLAVPYQVILFKVDGDYALMVFDARHNFERNTFIIRLVDFVPDGTTEL